MEKIGVINKSNINFKGVVEKLKEKEVFSNRYFYIFATLVYIVLYKYIWDTYCCEFFDYYGYLSYKGSFFSLIPTIVFAVLPIFFYNGIKTISGLLSIIIYVFAYVPIILSLMFGSEIFSLFIVLCCQVILCISMCVFFLTQNITRSFLGRIKTGKQIPFNYFIAFTVLLTLYMLYAYRGNMMLANFTEIYDLRATNDEITGSGLNGYFLNWLSCVFYPIILMAGVIKKNRIWAIGGAVGFLLLYMMTGQKTDLFMPVILITFYYFFKWQQSSSVDFYSLLIVGLLIFSIVLFAIPGEIGFLLQAVFFMRSITICGLLFNSYLEFFQQNPFTYYSHINVVNVVTNGYPYGNTPLGFVVADGTQNANASFWATDGIAACGPAGLIVIGVVFFIFLTVINSLEKKAHKDIILISFIPSLISLLNGSFFTYLLTKGVFLIIIIYLLVDFSFLKKETNEYKKIE